MIALKESFHNPTVEQHHAQFLALMPKLELHATIYFRHVRCPARRDDKIQECLALGWKWYLRLQEKGKDVSEFPMVFVFVVARAVKCGRRMCGQEKAKDAMSELAQQRHGFKMESLPASPRSSYAERYGEPGGQRVCDAFEAMLTDDTQTPIPEQVSFRIDWPEFLQTLTHRDRELAEYLSLGNSGKDAANRFKLSPGRVTQLRQRWCREWRIFQGLAG